MSGRLKNFSDVAAIGHPGQGILGERDTVLAMLEWVLAVTSQFPTHLLKLLVHPAGCRANCLVQLRVHFMALPSLKELLQVPMGARELNEFTENAVEKEGCWIERRHLRAQ